MTETRDLIKQGRLEEVWQKHCGFLDLDVQEFLRVQESLLIEQLDLAGHSELGRKIMGNGVPHGVEQFRQVVPLTDYQDYEPYLTEHREDVLPAPAYAWAHTSGRSGRLKWVPYTKVAFRKMGERTLGAIILGAARERGEVRIRPGDAFVTNVPARPYASGQVMVALGDIFDFRFIPPLDETEEMSFQERIVNSFQTALGTGIDVIGSITSVMVKMGERFSEGAGSTKLTRDLLKPRVIFRLARAMVRSKMAGRAMLPKDLWDVKAIMCGGTDTALFRDKITEYWGAEPFEGYVSTETLIHAGAQAWDRKGIYFYPDAVFLEFIPEDEWKRNREDSEYQPSTVLLDEVETGQRYEVVITSFDGMPFLRYRMRDLVRFISLSDEEVGIRLPSMIFAGRSDDLIDLAGFTGLMDEQMISQAIYGTGIPYVDWTVRKEGTEEGAFLHLYIELKGAKTAQVVRDAVHEALKELNPFYADLEAMLGMLPLQVTLVAAGTFAAFTAEKQAAGADLSHFKPKRMKPSDAVLEDLLRLSRQMGASQEA